MSDTRIHSASRGDALFRAPPDGQHRSDPSGKGPHSLASTIGLALAMTAGGAAAIVLLVAAVAAVPAALLAHITEYLFPHNRGYL